MLGHAAAYPGKFAALLAGPDDAQEAMTLIQEDWAVLLEMEREATKSDTVAGVLSKILWSKQPAVRLIFCLFERANWALAEDFRASLL